MVCQFLLNWNIISMSELQLCRQLGRSIKGHYVWEQEETWKFLQGLSPTVQKGKQMEREQTHQVVAGKVFSSNTEACRLTKQLQGQCSRPVQRLANSSEFWEFSSSESLPVLKWAFLVMNLLWSYPCSSLSISLFISLLVTTITILYIY